MTRRTKVRKSSGRIKPRYHEKLSFDERVENDFLDENIYWDDWNDYRDGFRNNFCEESFNKEMKRTKQYKQKQLFKKKRLNKISTFINN